MALGKDFSGNGNYCTTNNISITAGATYDSMTDVPTLTSATTANYCVLNPLNNTGTTASANLNWNGTDKAILSTTAFPTTGKYYFEATCSTVANFSIIGIANAATYASAFNGVLSSANFRTYNSGGEKANSTRTASWGSTFTSNDIIGVAVDMDNGAIYFAKNNTWQASGVPTSGASKTGAAFTDLTSSGLTWTPFFSATNINGVWIANFGQRPFAYTPPTGFVALNTFNLPNSTIVAGNKQMDISLYSGNNANPRSITGVNLQPDFVWVKQRSSNGGGATFHQLYDSVRGTQKLLRSNTTDAELANPSNGGVQSFDSNGFTIQGSSASLNMNQTGETYVGWQWKAGGTAVTNTAGSISAQVSANPTAGFSIVTYTGTGSAATVGHGLGVAPRMVIVKCRSNAISAPAWPVWHTSIPASNYLDLQTTIASSTASSVWNSTLPTSSVFSIGTTSSCNSSGFTYVAYCFAQIAGYSAFGSYNSNASADGPFVYLGFRPRWLMIKKATGSVNANSGWYIYDTARGTINVMGPTLRADLSEAESTFNSIDFLSNGFKIRAVDIGINSSTSGDTYIYMAFAENPFRNALAR